MVPAMVVVFMLNLVRIFQSFEIELILGKPVGFYTYSTKIFAFLRFFDPPEYGAAAALASITLLIIALVIPLQHWLTTRRHYTTVTGQFKPGLLDLGQLRPFVLGAIVFLLLFLTVVPVLTLIGGSFMLRVGFFNLNSIFTMRHWTTVLSDSFFLQALRTTLTLALSTAILTPLIFSLIAYVLVRTRWRGRQTLDSIFWISSAVPGMLAGLGLLWLFLGTPIFQPLYGTIWALLLVVILQGKLISTQLIKGVYLQMGSDMEEAARVSGAGLVVHVRAHLAAADHADADTHRHAQLRVRRTGDCEHHLAGQPGHQDPLDHGPGDDDTRGWPASGGGRDRQPVHRCHDGRSGAHRSQAGTAARRQP